MKLSGKAGEAFIVILGRAFLALGSLITVRIATELMTPEQMGTVTQMVSVASLFGLVLLTPVWHYMARGFREWHETGMLLKYIKQFLAYIVMATCVVLVVVWFVQALFHPVANLGTGWVVILAGLYFVSVSVSTIGTSGFNILNHRIHFVLLANIPIWMGLCLAVIMFRVTAIVPFWVLGLFLGYALAGFSVVLLYIKLKREKINPSSDLRSLPFDVKAVFAFAWPVVLSAALWWLQSQSYRFIIPGTSNVGLFAMAYTLAAAPLALYEGIFGQFYEPIYYKDLKFQGPNGQATAWNNYAALYLPGVIVMGIFVASSGHYLAALLLGEEYRKTAETIVVWVAIIETMRGVGAMNYHLGVAKVDSRVNLLPIAVGSTLSVLGVLIFSRIDPLMGSVFGLFLAGFFVLIIVLRVSIRHLSIIWPYGKMLKAALFSVPLIVGFWAAKLILKDENVWSTISILSIGGIYMLAVQFMQFRGAMKARGREIQNV
jgi:O-antigen/teichoic acid export membrane protein